MKHQGLAMAAACGSVAGVAAAQQTAADVMPARLMGHVYIKAATGERLLSPATASRSSEPYWINADTDGSCGFFYAVDRPTRDTATGFAKFGGAVVHWGDTVPGAEVNGYEVAYASNIGCDTTGAGLAGLDIINIFLQDYDGVVDPGGASASRVAALVIEDIHGGVCTLGTSLFAGWVYTVDLEGTGDEFSFGGNDLDGDGLHDFGYSYSFVQGQSEPKGLIGPLLVRPASLGGAGTAAGSPDRLDWFNQLAGPSSLSDYVGGFWFGGGACPTTPYASTYLVLYGPDGGNSCDLIEYTGDGVIDFSDYLEFLNRYDTSDPTADLNFDGLVDFTDWLDFYNLYYDCQSTG